MDDLGNSWQKKEPYSKECNDSYRGNYHSHFFFVSCFQCEDGRTFIQRAHVMTGNWFRI